MTETTDDTKNIFGGSIPEHVLSMGDWNKSPLKFFQKFDGPFVKRTVVINNHALRKILQKNFEYMSRNLCFISLFGRFLLRDEKANAVLDAEKIAASTLQNAMNSVQRRIDQAKILLAANDIPEDTQNTKVSVMEVPLTSPGARQYIELLVMADYFYNLNALLWIDGKIDNVNKFANESATRKDVQAAVRGIANQFGYILNLTRKKDPQEAAKAGEHDEATMAAQAVDVMEQFGATGAGGEQPAAAEGQPTGDVVAEDKKPSRRKAGAKADEKVVAAEA